MYTCVQPFIEILRKVFPNIIRFDLMHCTVVYIGIIECLCCNTSTLSAQGDCCIECNAMSRQTRCNRLQYIQTRLSR